jgi:trehalose-6-phosphate synthase
MLIDSIQTIDWSYHGNTGIVKPMSGTIRRMGSMNGVRKSLRLLVDEVNRRGGRLEIQDSVVHVQGDLPAPLLLKLHRHRRHIASAIR